MDKIQIMVLAYIGIVLMVLGGIGYVLVHFISKFW